MTKQSDVKADPNYTPYLDHGFVGLVEVMGSDQSIEQSARMSYGKGTRTRSDTRNLIRYLVRNYHTSPLEMGELRFHLKIPIVVMRQFVRHRTASLNEYSGRYSEMVDEFYVPDESRIQMQSTDNKQGSGDIIDDEEARLSIIEGMELVNQTAYSEYQRQLTLGVSREIARIVLPISNYTELYWKVDLHNFMKLLQQRLHKHAQWEIRDLAQKMYDMVAPFFPIACEAFEDYWLNGSRFSAEEMRIIQVLLSGISGTDVNDHLSRSNLSVREKQEFMGKILL